MKCTDLSNLDMLADSSVEINIMVSRSFVAVIQFSIQSTSHSTMNSFGIELSSSQVEIVRDGVRKDGRCMIDNSPGERRNFDTGCTFKFHWFLFTDISPVIEVLSMI